MVGSGVEQLDVLLVADLLELSAGELLSVVQHDAARGPVVCHILPKCLCDMCSVFSFEGEEPNKPTVVVYDSESIPEAMVTRYHVRQVYAYPLKRLRHRW